MFTEQLGMTFLQRVSLVVTVPDDLPAYLLARVAEKAKSFEQGRRDALREMPTLMVERVSAGARAWSVEKHELRHAKAPSPCVA